ncbi:MAG: DUF484 family protein [Gammaproteobacteria bacterium]|nr:DUF484 family protein [Gammaproteobacteria bacterium]
MSSLEQREADVAEINETGIAAYLKAHPDFFERHRGLLDDLKLPHRTGGPAVSLVERQVAVLRQNNLKLERKLRDLVEVARSNDELAKKIHELAMLLMHQQGQDAVVNCLEQQLRLSFRADRAVLVLFDDGAQREESRFLRILPRGADALAPFKTFLESGSTRCGRVRDAQYRFLFGDDDLEIGSVALLPLGAGAKLGFLAIGNRDANHFHPGKSIDFLAKLGELIACALGRPAEAA